MTTPIRTAMDLGCVLKRREAYAALNEFSRVHLLTQEDFRRVLPRYRRRRGVIQLRELIQITDPRIESPRESWVRLAIHDAQLPAPMPQFVVYVGSEDFRLDFAYAGSRVAVEYDGEAAHSTPEDRQRDAYRRDVLRAVGWQFVVVKRGDFTSDRLDAWLRTLRGHLEPRYSTLRSA